MKLKFLGVLLLVCLMVIGASAVIIWTGAAGDGKYSTDGNWDTAGHVQCNTTDEVRVNTGTVNVDCDATVGMFRLAYAASTNACTVNFTAAAGFTGHTFTVTKATTELISVGYLGAATINQDTGTVKAYNGSGTGEIRIMRNATNPQSYYYLSGGLVSSEVIRGGFTGTNLGLVDTGGTIAANNIYRLGSYTTLYTWTQGGSTLSPGGSIGNTNVGQSGYEAKWITSASSKEEVQLDAAGYDTFHGAGNADLTLGTLDLTASYSPAVNSFFDIIKLDLKDTTKEGVGTFSSITTNLPGYFTAQWLDLDSSGKKETLRVTYIPEPATIALLSFGLLAIRRRK